MVSTEPDERPVSLNETLSVWLLLKVAEVAFRMKWGLPEAANCGCVPAGAVTSLAQAAMSATALTALRIRKCWDMRASGVDAGFRVDHRREDAGRATGARIADAG